MAELRLRTIDEAEIDTVIGEDINFEGTLRVDHPSLIKGRLTGSIVTTSDVYIHQSAEVDADISTHLISIRGNLKGKVTASQRIELFQTGSLSADIQTPDLYIQSGSRFNGSCTMEKSGDEQND